VPRHRLVEHLDRRRNRPLTLVTAPAGCGKTTLVSSWRSSMTAPDLSINIASALLRGRAIPR
jgi:ATP/maltotriose-dependent transcriptional regulator MalT